MSAFLIGENWRRLQVLGKSRVEQGWNCTGYCSGKPLEKVGFEQSLVGGGRACEQPCQGLSTGASGSGWSGCMWDVSMCVGGCARDRAGSLVLFILVCKWD